jgi:hypothetical protein
MSNLPPEPTDWRKAVEQRREQNRQEKVSGGAFGARERSKLQAEVRPPGSLAIPDRLDPDHEGAAGGGQEKAAANGASGQQSEAGIHVPDVLSVAEWLAREIPDDDVLLGPFTNDTRAEFSADTGLGKTMFAIGLNVSLALRQQFLHWQVGRSGRALLIDGEMPPRLIHARVAAACSWFPGMDAHALGRDRLCILSRADVEDMPPLDTPEGCRWLFGALEQLGQFDHITIDNRAAFSAGDLSADDESTNTLKRLQREITKRGAGQLWLHHTGLDTSRGYGRKQREWELDHVLIGEKIDRPGTDVAFQVSFTKARRRTPETRDDYQAIDVELRAGRWEWAPSEDEPGPPKRPIGRNQQHVLDAATKLLASSNERAPPGHPAGHRTVVSVDAVKAEARKLMACEPKHFATRFAEALDGLTAARRLTHYDGAIWS